MCRPPLPLPSASSTRVGRKPASVLPAPVGATSRAERPTCAAASSASWCGRGAQPRAANHSAKAGGKAVGEAGDGSGAAGAGTGASPEVTSSEGALREGALRERALRVGAAGVEGLGTTGM